LENMIAGVIFVGLSYDRSFQNSLHILSEHEVPVVYVNRAIPYQGYPLVYHDYYQAGRLAAEHLCGVGKRKLAVIGRVLQDRVLLQHIPGFLDTAQGCGFEVSSEDVLEIGPGFPLSPELVARLAYERVDGIFATNELIAVGLIKELSRQGIRIPEDTAIIGLGNSVFGEIISPELTCIDLQNHLTGIRSAEVLLAQIAGEAYENVTVLAPRLMKRNSA